jgi:hypothetical protein
VKRKPLPPCAPWFRSVHDRGRRPQPANGMTSPRTAGHESLDRGRGVLGQVRVSLGHLILEGVFERYPTLRVGSAEHELAWVPFFLDRLDYTHTQRARRVHWHRYRGDALPSDFFRRNTFLSFQEDAMGIRDRSLIGVGGLMWGSDYPYTESTFPRSRVILERILEGVPHEERRQITARNAAQLYRLTLGTSLFTRRGVAELQELPLPAHTAHRREESLELLAWLDARIATLERKIAGVAEADPDALRLMTHPGVGPLTALATLLVLGPVARFPTSKHVVSYVGLAPAIASSAGKHRLGGITKQGNRMLRFVLGQAGHTALRADPHLKQLYYRVLHRRGRARAKVAVARALLVRLYIMQRDQIDYAEFRHRGQVKAA